MNLLMFGKPRAVFESCQGNRAVRAAKADLTKVKSGTAHTPVEGCEATEKEMRIAESRNNVMQTKAFDRTITASRMRSRLVGLLRAHKHTSASVVSKVVVSCRKVHSGT